MDDNMQKKKRTEKIKNILSVNSVSILNLPDTFFPPINEAINRSIKVVFEFLIDFDFISCCLIF